MSEPTETMCDEARKATERVRTIARNHPEVVRLTLFGSRARGDWNSHSDHDVFAEFDYDKISWVGYIQLIRDLEAALNTSVDLVSGADIAMRSPVLWSQIQKDGVVIYERSAD